MIAAALLARQQPNFALHSNDRVVFYGDSITDNNPWTYYIAYWVTERFPEMNIYYVNAGTGGDKVSGGWMGPVDTRLTRDVFSHRPTVITSMLGMNDGLYKPYDQGTFDTYVKGYRHILDRIKKEAPDARTWLFTPTPYDDVTRAPNWADGGYSGVMEKFGAAVRDLATEYHTGVVDQTAPMNAMLAAANKIDPKTAQTLLPDRVHPDYAAELVMMEDVIKAWGGDDVVSSTTITWDSGNAQTYKAKYSNWNKGSFDLKEDVLPFAINRPDAKFDLVLKSSNFDHAMNQEVLIVAGMPDGKWTLKIDGNAVGTFTSDNFGRGIELENYDTPMYRQAQQVQNDINNALQTRFSTWRNIIYTMADFNSPAKAAAVKAMDNLADAWYQKARQDAVTKSHHFEIVPATSN